MSERETRTEGAGEHGSGTGGSGGRGTPSVDQPHLPCTHYFRLEAVTMRPWGQCIRCQLVGKWQPATKPRFLCQGGGLQGPHLVLHVESRFDAVQGWTHLCPSCRAARDRRVLAPQRATVHEEVRG